MQLTETRSKIYQTLTTAAGVVYPKWASQQSGMRFSPSAMLHGDHKSPNPLTFNKYEWECLRGTLTCAQPGVYGWRSIVGATPTSHFNEFNDFGTPLRDGFSAVFNDALSQIYSGGFASDGVRGDLDLTIDGFQLGQLRNTLNRATHGITTLRNSINRIKRHSDPGLVAMNQVGSYYLEWWYGIRPTLETLQSLGEELFDKVEDATCVKSYKAYAKRVVKSLFRGDTVWYTGGTYVPRATYTVETETTYRCRIDVRLQTSRSKLQKLGRYVSLNPAAWAYELCPYSFVLDWVWNFGGFMRDLESSLMYADLFAGGYYTNTAIRKAEVVAMSNPSNTGGGSFRLDGGGKGTVKYLRRVVLSSLPSPKIPSFDPQLGSKRLLAAAALLSQQVGKKLPFRPAIPRQTGGKPGLIWDPSYSF